MLKNQIVVSSLFNLDLIRIALQTKYKLNEKDLDKFRKELDEEFKEAKEKGDVKLYTFTSYEDLIKSINNDLYEFLSIIQSITKCPQAHYLCVKEHLLRNKPIKALKSFMVLVQDKNSNNFYSYKANCLIKQYIKDNEGKIQKEVLDFINNKLNEIDIKPFETFNNVGDAVDKIKYQLLNCENMFDENNAKHIEQYIDEIKNEDIRKCKSKNLNEMFNLLSLYIGSEAAGKIQEKIRDKIKIKIDNYDEEVKGNLTLYQSVEEARKLFPDYRHKEHNEEKKDTETETKDSESNKIEKAETEKKE
jgi:hypothetical protein